MSPTLSELTRVAELLKKEKEEELAQYDSFVKNSSLNERRRTGICWYPVIIKEDGYWLGDYPYLIIERPEKHDQPHQFSGGKAVSLFSQKGNVEDSVQGTINYLSGNRMKIILYADERPEWLDEGKIGINLLFDANAYREMENALKKVILAEGNRLAELREILLGEKAPRFKNKAVHESIEGLNDSKQEAVNRILEAEDVAIIHGPPGTGKTTTLVKAIKLLSTTEKNILVCAPSNAAADLLTERLAAEGLKVVRVGNISRVDEAILSHTVEGTMSSHPEMKEIKRLRKQADEYRRLASKYKRHFGKAERDQRNLLLKEAKMLLKDASAREQMLVDNILGHADAITCTLVGSMNRYIESHEFYSVFIDEAGQALEPAAWVPITKANRVIMAGDPYQLPPTVKSIEAERGGLSVTLLEKCITRLPQICLLDVQYRMHEKIMGFPNRQFYRGALKTHESVRGHQLETMKNHPVEFIDTAGCSFDEQQNPESQSLFNPGEYEILSKHLKEVLASVNPDSIPSIAVISPYREQVIFIKESMSADPDLNNFIIDINTVDSFQGQERDLVYISLVRSNENGEIGFLGDYRRMNVAMTRARKKLVMIGDSATLGRHSFYEDLLKYCEEQGGYFSAWEWMT